LASGAAKHQNTIRLNLSSWPDALRLLLERAG
jgi:hypothetical protein